jgi:hypothetical protein
MAVREASHVDKLSSWHITHNNQMPTYIASVVPKYLPRYDMKYGSGQVAAELLSLSANTAARRLWHINHAPQRDKNAEWLPAYSSKSRVLPPVAPCKLGAERLSLPERSGLTGAQPKPGAARPLQPDRPPHFSSLPLIRPSTSHRSLKPVCV